MRTGVRRMSSKYRRFLSRLLPDTTGRFREYSRKWLIVCVPLGLLTGLLVLALNEVVVRLLPGQAGGLQPGQGLTTDAFNASPAVAFALPFAGLLLAGIVLWRFASRPLLSGTEEVVEHYHQDEGPMGVREGAVKYLCAVLTVGLGGAAGLEGPSINAGGVVGSWMWARFRSTLGLARDDLRIILLAGASAGIAAVFKAPLTGIVFAIEVPYKDDIAKKAFLPSIISGVTSYATFVSVEGPRPLFSFAAGAGSFTALDLALSALLGLLIGLVAVWFSRAYSALRAGFASMSGHVVVRLAVGGAVVGAVALLVDLLYSGPFALGPGYELVQGALSGSYAVQFLAVILLLRMVSTAFTLGSGGVGGMFVPLVVFGSLTGSLFALLFGQSEAVFACVGLAAFMSAGYKTPLAAVTFVGDTTGSVSYLIPAMIGSAVAYVTSGSASVSDEQKLWEESPAPPPVKAASTPGQ